MLTFTLSIGSVIVGFCLGIGFSFFALWLADRDNNRSNEEPSAFSKGFDAGWFCKGEYEDGKLKKDLRVNKKRGGEDG